MGQYLTEARVKVVLLALPKAKGERLAQRLTTRSAEDPGNVEVVSARTFDECRTKLKNKDATAICVNVGAFKTHELVDFIGEIRGKHELVPFCLAANTSWFEDMPGVPKNWRERFGHYYRLELNTSDADFTANAAVVRDLFIADAVKVRAMQSYQTVTGSMVKLRVAPSLDVWHALAIALAMLLIGAFVNPLGERLVKDCDEVAPANAKQSATTAPK